jgi:RimJ/RimL family protein N-acetyltransferase
MTSALTVRPLSPDDREAVTEFLRGLSMETMYRRFFSLPRVDDRLVDLVAHPSECCSDALVAFAGDALVGVASYDRRPDDTGAAEVAVVIGDEWQHHGVGTELMAALTRAARRKGIERFTATMLSDNRAVVDFVHHTAPAARLQFDGTELAMDLSLLRRPA